MIITHNHYDHLDKNAIQLLNEKTRAFHMPLGVSKNIRPVIKKMWPLIELDWWQSVQVSEDVKLTATPARHFSGRGLKRNQSLWSSFVLQINGYSIFIGSDSGFGPHFKTIGDKYGPFDISILECVQYNTDWPYIHSQPEEFINEAKDVDTKMVMPVHWPNKFTCSCEFKCISLLHFEGRHTG